MRKICVVTGTRADWGLLSPIAKALKARPDVIVQIVATNMHLSPKFGNTYKEILADGFKINCHVSMLDDTNTPGNTVRSMGVAMSGFASVFEELKPDMILILGDRYEMLTVAGAALIFGIPIAHIAGGAVSRGAYDDSIRHCITKMSHLHLTETEAYRRRVIQLGENPKYVFNVGAMGVYNINQMQYPPREELEQSIGTTVPEGSLLCTFHPATLDSVPPKVQCENLLSALDQFPDHKVIFTYPNNDTNGAVIIDLINAYAKAHPDRVAVFPSLGMKKFLSALHCVSAVIGNSSSGIVEVPSMRIPTLNIGIRQLGRMAADSVVNCGVSVQEIAEGLRTVLSDECQERCRHTVNPYEQPDTLDKIVKVVCETPLDNITIKPFYDLQ